MGGARGLDAAELTNSARNALVGARGWANHSVPVAVVGCSGGGLSLAAIGVVDAALSLAGADTMTVRVVVDVKPELPVTT